MHKFITPRVGSDNAVCYSESMFFDFNPRSPCGERLAHEAGLLGTQQFQSTLPVWGATIV